MPLVIHAREADDDMARILEEEMGKGAFPAVLHCFTGGPELARRALALGCSYRFTGIVTFKNSDELREIAKMRSGRTVSWSRPTRRISRRCRIAASATSRPMSSRSPKVLAEVRGVTLDEIAPPDHGEFLPAVRKGAASRRRPPHER